jgi:hypothetical protein
MLRFRLLIIVFRQRGEDGEASGSTWGPVESKSGDATGMKRGTA